MYYVCQIRNNLLGAMSEHEALEDALAEVGRIVSENGVELTEEVLDEIAADWCYLSDDKEWSVGVGTPD